MRASFRVLCVRPPVSGRSLHLQPRPGHAKRGVSSTISSSRFRISNAPRARVSPVACLLRRPMAFPPIVSPFCSPVLSRSAATRHFSVLAQQVAESSKRQQATVPLPHAQAVLQLDMMPAAEQEEDFIAQLTESISVADLIAEKGCADLYTVLDSAPLREAARSMVERKVGSLLVVDSKEEVVGLMTERDYLRGTLASDSSKVKVSAVMTPLEKFVHVTGQTTVGQCMQLMTAHGIRHLPVFDQDDNVIGMLSIKDVVKKLVSDYNFEVQRLREYIEGNYAA